MKVAKRVRRQAEFDFQLRSFSWGVFTVVKCFMSSCLLPVLLSLSIGTTGYQGDLEAAASLDMSY